VRKYDPAKVGKHLHEQVLAHFGQDEFLDTMQRFRAVYRLGNRAPRLHVLRHPARRVPADMGRLSPGTTDLAVEAAAIVAALLARAHRVGVCWGYHLGLVVGALAHIPLNRVGRHPTEVIPLAGEPFDGNLNRLSSTSLAQELMTLLNGKSPGELLSLTMVPAVRPNLALGFDEYLLQIPGYRAIFGEPTSKQRARIDGLDAILTGVSHVGFPWGRRQRRMYPDEDKFKVLADALGDIGGVLLLESKHPSNEALRTLQQRWTGLQPTHLRELALRAANAKSERTPGVICIAAGASKAACCIEALRLGYVNHLIVDKELGEKLMKAITEDVTSVVAR
jgi:DNA-binding transcriptional regulator LsrR (DeoR family)